MEMFQRSFTEDDIDEAILLEAANDWEDTPPEDIPGQHLDKVGQSPSRKSIRDFFGRWLNFVQIQFNIIICYLLEQ